MAQLWVKTYGGDWLRADQIIEVGIATVPAPRDTAETTEVVARLAAATGSGDGSVDRDGTTGPGTRILGRYPDGDTAQQVADRLVLVLLSAERNAQITFEADDVLVRPVDDHTTADTPYNGRNLDPR